MIFRLISLIIISFISFCCGCQNSTEKGRVKDPMIYKNQYLVENVVGKWGALNGSDPLFTFSSDSFFVNDISKGYHYQIINKSIIIDYPNVFRVLRNVKVNEDTLSFIDDYGVVVKGYRIQNN